MEKIRRSRFATYLNTAAPGSPYEWALLGVGITSAEITYNPNIETVTYIHEDSGNAEVEGYAPAMPVEATAVKGDPAFDAVDAMRKGRNILTAALTSVLNVWLYETPIHGAYPSEIQAAVIAIESFGGEGGLSSKINYSLNYQGDRALAWFDPLTEVATLAPVDAVLDTMVIGTVTLDPLFASDKTFLWYEGAVPNATTAVSMTSTCLHPDAVIVQKVGATVVGQGANATLAVGENTLTIQVTVGSEVVTYTITITRAAA